MSPLQILLQQAYEQEQMQEAQFQLKRRMHNTSRGEPAPPLEQLIAKYTGQAFDPDDLQAPGTNYQDPNRAYEEVDIGDHPTLMDILRQFNAN